MADIQAGDIADMLVAGQNQLGKNRFTNLTSDLQEHIGLNQLVKRKKETVGNGTGFSFNVLTENDNNSRWVGFFDVDNVNQADGLTTGTVPWRHHTSGWTIDTKQTAMIAGESKLIDFLKTKRTQMIGRVAEDWESMVWGEPSSSTDNTSLFGLRYWMVYNATTGFNGGNNSNFSSGPAGLDRDTYARWKNYTFQYTNVTKADLIAKARKASWSCKFKPPVAIVPDYASSGKYGYYTTYDVVATLEEVLESQNDNLGNSLDPMTGKSIYGRIPVIAVPWLQANRATSDPFVGIDWSVLKIVFLKGRFMRETPAKVSPTQHDAVQGFLDNSAQLICTDCRRLFLGAKSDWATS